MVRHRVLRSWPWTIALATVLAGFVLLGVVGLGIRSSGAEVLISLVVSAASAAGVVRVLSMGAKITPSGVIIRDLTRTTMVPWARVRSVTSAQVGRRVHVPVLVMGQKARDVAGRGIAEPAGRKGGRRGLITSGDRVEITVLGSYRLAVAQRRADELERARTAATSRTR